MKLTNAVLYFKKEEEKDRLRPIPSWIPCDVFNCYVLYYFDHFLEEVIKKNVKKNIHFRMACI